MTGVELKGYRELRLLLLQLIWQEGLYLAPLYANIIKPTQATGSLGESPLLEGSMTPYIYMYTNSHGLDIQYM
jgi:hypothetical protein